MPSFRTRLLTACAVPQALDHPGRYLREQGAVSGIERWFTYETNVALALTAETAPLIAGGEKSVVRPLGGPYSRDWVAATAKWGMKVVPHVLTRH